MKKKTFNIIILTEGQCELLFTDYLIEIILKKTKIHFKKITASEPNEKMLTESAFKFSNVKILIKNVHGQGNVNKKALEVFKEPNGYDRIIALQDVPLNKGIKKLIKPIRLKKIKSKLEEIKNEMYDITDKTILSMHYAVMELEAWILSDTALFKILFEIEDLTDFELSETNLSKINPEEILSPSKLLSQIYNKYKNKDFKKREEFENILSSVDFDYLISEQNLKKVPSFKSFYIDVRKYLKEQHYA